MRAAFASGWRQLRSESKRHVLPFVTLTIGVAMLFGTLLAAQGAATSVSDGVRSLTTFGDIGVVPASGFDAIPQAAVDGVSRIPGVESTLPTFSSSSAVQKDGGGSTSRDVTVTGYPTSADSIVERVVSEGRLPDGEHAEALVPTDVASALGVGLRSSLEVATSAGQRSVAVVGLADPASLGVFGRDNVFVTLSDAQSFFDARDEVTRIDLVVNAPDASSWGVRHARDLPSEAAFQDTAAVAGALDPVQQTLGLLLLVCGTVVLLISVLLTGVAFRSSVVARAPTFGLLRTVGATSGWLARGVLAEAGLIGVAATAIGLSLGYAGSWAAAVLTAPAGSPTSGPPTLAFATVALCVGAGIAAALAGAGRAILGVSRTSPTDLSKRSDESTEKNSILQIVTGSVLLGAGCAALATHSEEFAFAGFACLCGSTIVLAPVLLRILAQGVARHPDWRLAAAGRRNSTSTVLGMPARVASVLACISVALCVGVGAIGSAMETQISKQFGADVQVSVPVAQSASLGDRLAAVAGVGVVTATGDGQVEVSHHAAVASVGFLAVDPTTYFSVAQLPWKDGDDRSTPKRFDEGAKAIVPVAVAEELGLQPGDAMEVARNGATASVEVVATFSSLATGNQIILPCAVASRLGSAGVTGYDISAVRGADVLAVRDRVAREMAAVPGATVITGVEMKARASSQLTAYTSVVLGVVGIALVFGAIGASSVFAGDVARRRREFASLHAVGATRISVLALVFGGTGLVALTAVLLGIGLGWPAGILLTSVVGGSLGVAITPEFPIVSTIGVVAMLMAALVAATVVPARRGLGVSPADALREE